MRPSELSDTLRKIAAKIDASKSPDRTTIANDLRRVITATESGCVMIYVSKDMSFYSVMMTDEIVPKNGTSATVHLPDGNSMTLYSSLDVLKQNEDMDSEELRDALFNAGLTEADGV
jgi:hypothetical protein